MRQNKVTTYTRTMDMGTGLVWAPMYCTKRMGVVCLWVWVYCIQGKGVVQVQVQVRVPQVQILTAMCWTHCPRAAASFSEMRGNYRSIQMG